MAHPPSLVFNFKKREQKKKRKGKKRKKEEKKKKRKKEKKEKRKKEAGLSENFTWKTYTKFLKNFQTCSNLFRLF